MSTAIRMHPIRVLGKVSQVFDVSVNVLVSRDRHKHIAIARMAGYLVMRNKGFSFPEIGRAFLRDHTTVISGVRRAQALCVSNSEFFEMVSYCERSL